MLPISVAIICNYHRLSVYMRKLVGNWSLNLLLFRWAPELELAVLTARALFLCSPIFFRKHVATGTAFPKDKSA